jgi:hypothetical protein
MKKGIGELCLIVSEKFHKNNPNNTLIIQNDNLSHIRDYFVEKLNCARITLGIKETFYLARNYAIQLTHTKHTNNNNNSKQIVQQTNNKQTNKTYRHKYRRRRIEIVYQLGSRDQ